MQIMKYQNHFSKSEIWLIDTYAMKAQKTAK